jgi:hypothetical protein
MKTTYSLITLLSASMVLAAPAPFVDTARAVARSEDAVMPNFEYFSKRGEAKVDAKADAGAAAAEDPAAGESPLSVLTLAFD